MPTGAAGRVAELVAAQHKPYSGYPHSLKASSAPCWQPGSHWDRARRQGRSARCSRGSCRSLAAGCRPCFDRCALPALPSVLLLLQDILLVEHQRPWPGCGPDAAAAAAAGEDLALGGSSSSGGGSARCSCCGAATDEYSLFAVFDGHNGAAAATLVADNLVAYLEERLPAGPPPASSSPGFLPWREDIQLALVETLAELNKLFAAKGILAGCTATLCLQVRGRWSGTARMLSECC